MYAFAALVVIVDAAAPGRSYLMLEPSRRQAEFSARSRQDGADRNVPMRTNQGSSSSVDATRTFPRSTCHTRGYDTQSSSSRLLAPTNSSPFMLRRDFGLCPSLHAPSRSPSQRIPSQLRTSHRFVARIVTVASSRVPPANLNHG
nr:hypothetical protein CFP56_65889 [Quercus suber]